MTFQFSQIFATEIDAKALWTHIHGAGSQPNTMDHLTHTDLREALFVP